MGDIWVEGSDVASGNIDTVGNPATSTDYVVFQLPAGRYDIMLEASSEEQVSTSTQAIALVEVMSGTDDALLQTVPGYQASSDANTPGFQEQKFPTLLLPDFVTDGTKQLYFIYVGTAPER